MTRRMGNLRLDPDPCRHAYFAFRKGKYVGIVLACDLEDGKHRLRRGRVARRDRRRWQRRTT